MKKVYVERDLSWMFFNHRILQEAEKKDIPALERLSFLGIYSNNLDEFFRVRMASLNRVAASKDKMLKSERKEAEKTIKEINRLNVAYAKEYEEATNDAFSDLKKQGVRILLEDELNDEQKSFIKNLYIDRLNGLTNPIWLSQLKDISEDGIYLAIKQNKWVDGEAKPKINFALIKIPDKEAGRFIVIPSSENFNNIMYLDDVIRFCLPLIFAGEGTCTYDAYSFKVTKDAEMELDNDLDAGVLQKVAKGVRSRKSGEPIRVIYDNKMPKDLLTKVMHHLNVDQLDTIINGGRYQNHKDLMSFPD